jgi:TonB-linked SusC/RagA family outer membrane protein
MKLLLVTVMMGVSLYTYSADIIVTGRVLEAGTNVPLPGVNVSIQGGNGGTITNLDGRFQIKAAEKGSVLVVSYIGFITQNIPVDNNSTFNVLLREDSQNLEEVVVVGYGKQKKESVLGAISTVSTKDLLKSPTSNIGQSLTGKIPGLITSQSQGQPGYDDVQLFIRGRASFASDNAPLILVDGVERTYSQISPDDIEHVSVLKDASATAVYGVRGANGVVLITTKRGSDSKPSVSFSANLSTQSPTRTPQFLDSYNSVLLLNEALSNDGLAPQYSAADVEKYRQSVNGTLTGNDKYLYPNVDWYNEALNKSAPSQQYSVNVAGGTKRMKYFTSLTYFNQEGLYKNTDNYDYGNSSNASYKRYSFRANLDFALTQKLNLAVNIGTRFENRHGPNVGESSTSNEVFYELNRTPGWVFPVQYPNGLSGGSAFAKNNIVAKLQKGGFHDMVSNINETSFIATHELDFITKGLSAKAMLSMDYFSDYDRRFSAGFATYEYNTALAGDLMEKSSYNQFNEDTPLTNYANNQTTSMKTYMEFALNYNRTFGNNEVTGLFLYNQNDYRYQADIPKRYQGIVGRATYNYDRRYYTELNFGYNGSENFAKGRRFGLFPSLSMGWMISNENFLKNQNFLELLKLRATYGEVGNDNYNNARFLYVSSWIQGGGYTFGATNNQSGIYEGMFPNSMVTWERAKKYNVALEAGIKKQLLIMNIDLFYESRNDILTNYGTLASWLAVDMAPANLGKATNKGFELELKHRNNIGKVNYYINTAFSRAVNQIDYKDEPTGMPASQKREGHAINQYYGMVSDGFFTSQEQIDNSPKQTFGPVQVGDLKYVDVNEDNLIDDRDITFIGYSDIPQNSYSLSAGVDYKGISFSFMFQGVSEISRYYDAETMYAFVNGGKVREQHLNRWNPAETVANNLANATYPLLHYGSTGTNNQRLNTFFIQDGSFLRLKNVEIGYTLPTDVSKKLFTQEIRIFANGNNLITWDKLNNLIDPESNGSNKYPIMSVYNVGVNIKF